MEDILSYLDPTFISILEQRTFHYDSAYWSNKNEYNPLAGRTGFDSQETKLPTYWNTSFSKICLGMKVGNVTNFLVVNKQADSLHSLIADGQYRATSLGRDTWKTLIGSQASLQSNCNKEGFNAVGSNIQSSKARIGITNNEQNDCNSCDSRLGLGTGGIVTTQTRVVTWHLTHQTMVSKSSRPWDTFWCSDFQKPKGKTFDVKYHDVLTRQKLCFQFN